MLIINTKTIIVKGQVLLERGFHSFPFCFTLPQNIPSSCELLMGHVRYTAKITIQRSIFKSNYVVEEAFSVNDGPVDLNQIEAAMVGYKMNMVKFKKSDTNTLSIGSFIAIDCSMQVRD